MGVLVQRKGRSVFALAMHIVRRSSSAARTMGLSEDAIERLNSVECAVDVIGPVLAEGDLVLVKASRASGLDQFVRGVLAR